MTYAESKLEFSYGVDAHDIITFVDDEWLRFAAENDTPGLDRDAVVGRSIWKFIGGAETQFLYQLIFERVRETGKGATVPFRCDSPQFRRRMKLKIDPGSDGSLTFVSRQLSTESRHPVRLFDVSVLRTNAQLVVCSWCRRIEVGDQWLEVEQALRRLHLLSFTEIPGISHGICDDCLGAVMGEANALRRMGMPDDSGNGTN